MQVPLPLHSISPAPVESLLWQFVTSWWSLDWMCLKISNRDVFVWDYFIVILFLIIAIWTVCYPPVFNFDLKVVRVDLADLATECILYTYFRRILKSKILRTFPILNPPGSSRLVIGTIPTVSVIPVISSSCMISVLYSTSAKLKRKRRNLKSSILWFQLKPSYPRRESTGQFLERQLLLL